jgi:ABC-type multidrug transport system ATPase subunit
VQREEEDTFQGQKNLKMMNMYKKYGGWLGSKKIAVRNLTFGIDKKNSFGLVGPNGAGKSTTFNMLLNKVQKNAGKIELFHKKTSTKGFFKKFF